MVSEEMPSALSWMVIEPASTVIDHRRDLGLLAGVESVVQQLLQDDERPVLDRVPGLPDEFLLSTELHEARNPEGNPSQLRLRLCLGGSLWLRHNL